MSTIRKAARADLDAVCRIYDQIHTAEERGEATPPYSPAVPL